MGGTDVGRLIDALGPIEADGDEPGRSALRLLSGTPKAVVRLDDHARRAPYPILERAAKRFDAGTRGPVTVALASLYRDGRVRERAVAAIVDQPYPELLPLLVLRTVDAVAPVRRRARTALALLLGDNPPTYLPYALPVALLVAGRWRGAFAYGQVLAALLTVPAPVRETLTRTDDVAQRRLLLELGLTRGWLGLDALVSTAETDPDVRVRARAAEAACREAVWTRRPAVPRRLASSRRPDVRAVALTALARLGADDEVAGHLDDDAALVRAVARDAARRLGIDARAHYREAVAGTDPVPGAVAGLAETGTAADAVLLKPLLCNGSARIRGQAVRALRYLGEASATDLVPLLRDPSPAVIRAATLALRGAVPDEHAHQLLDDPRVEVRRAGYRLLRARPTEVWLPAALALVRDPAPALAGRARADVAGLVRRGVAPPEVRAAAARLAALARPLDPETAGRFARWLSVDEIHPVVRRGEDGSPQRPYLDR